MKQNSTTATLSITRRIQKNKLGYCKYDISIIIFSNMRVLYTGNVIENISSQ